jgi:hypothetical protein
MRLKEIKWNYLRRGFGEWPLRNIQLKLHKERENSELVYRSETWIPRKEYIVRLKYQPKFFTTLVPPSRRIIDVIK